MNKRERLAGHLLNLYWTGAGDAGYERTLYSFHEFIGLPSDHDSSIEAALKCGNDSGVIHEGKEITQTEYFLILADKILADIENNEGD